MANINKQIEFWEATHEQHVAGLELLKKLNRFARMEAVTKLPQYIRAELAEIVALAPKAVG